MMCEYLTRVRNCLSFERQFFIYNRIGNSEKGKMMGNIFGYIRVSSRDQNEDRQLIALKELAIPEKNIFVDKQSGKDFQRPNYKKMVRRLKKDDLLYIKRYDYYGRKHVSILNENGVL